MKRFICYAITAVLISFSLTSFSQDLDNAGQYMDAISLQRKNISKKFMSYVSAAAHGKRARKVENLRNKLLNEVQEARMNISGLPSYKGDKAYRDTTVNFLKLYFNILNDDYSKIINLEEIAEQSYDDMEAYMLAQEMVDKKLEEGNARMKEASEKFAAANNINLVDNKNELGEMIDQVHKLNVYYHEIYLVFFKPYKQESYMMEAMKKANITGIEQNKNSLLKYSEEGLQKISSLKAFQGDNSLLSACKTMLNFYVKEVKGSMGNISDYFLTKERFEEIQKEFKKKKSPTQADVDAYNKAVNDVNKATDTFNNTNNTLNKERTEALNDWNKTVNSFFDEHTPKYK